MIDTVGVKAARIEIAAIKVVAPAAASWVLDKEIELHGAAGVSDDVPLAAVCAQPLAADRRRSGRGAPARCRA